MQKALKRALIFIGGILLFVTPLTAYMQVSSITDCPAWSDPSHKNTRSSIRLKPGKKYRVLDRRKGYLLLQINKPFPTKRWVQKSCVSLDGATKADSSNQSTSNNDLQSLLVLSWHNSFCESHPNRKECRPMHNSASNRLVLHGLWPQPRSRVYCGVSKRLEMLDRQHRWRALPSIDYPPTLRKLLKRYFPGYLSGLDRHEWIKHGTCYSQSPRRYFHDALNLTAEVDLSLIGDYLRANIGQRVRLRDLRRLFARSFGAKNGSKLTMKCRRGLLSEIVISLRGRGDELEPLLQNAPSLPSRCYEGIVDAPGRFKRR